MFFCFGFVTCEMIIVVIIMGKCLFSKEERKGESVVKALASIINQALLFSCLLLSLFNRLVF